MQHWNKLPRGECSGGLYDHTVKMWRLCLFLIMLQSSNSGVSNSWFRQIWDVFGNTFFTCWRSASYFEFHQTDYWIFKIGYPHSHWVWFGLNCNFSLWDTSKVDFNGKKTEIWLRISSNWSMKIQNGMPLPFECKLGWTAFLATRTPQKWISRGKRMKNDFQGQPADLSM